MDGNQTTPNKTERLARLQRLCLELAQELEDLEKEGRELRLELLKLSDQQKIKGVLQNILTQKD